MSDETFARRLRALEDHDSPDPAFVDRLYLELSDELGFVRRTSTRTAPARPVPRPRPRRRSWPLLAVAALLVLGVGAFVASGGIKGPDDLLTRMLAGELGLARSTVVEAFEHLASEGLLETRIGSGTFVTSTTPPMGGDAPVDAMAGLKRAQPERLARLMTAAHQQFADRLAHAPRPFTTAMPDYDGFPMAQWSRLLSP